MKFFLCVMGMVLIIEGVPYFAFGEKMKNLLAMAMTMSDGAMRRFGFFLMAAGVFIVWIGTKN